MPSIDIPLKGSTNSVGPVASFKIFVEDFHKRGVDIDLVNRSIGTVGEDDWMAKIVLNIRDRLNRFIMHTPPGNLGCRYLMTCR